MHILIPRKVNAWNEESKAKGTCVMHYIDISFSLARPTGLGAGEGGCTILVISFRRVSFKNHGSGET